MHQDQIEQIKQKIKIKFPCANYVIRIIGANNESFIPAVIKSVQKNVPDLDEQSLVIRTSKNAKFITAQLSITAQSAVHLQKINADLLATKMVKMVL